MTVTVNDFPLCDQTCVLVRGLPGAGKSDLTAQWVRQAPDRRIRVNRDDLRAELFNAEGLLLRPQEDLVTAVQIERALTALAAGQSVAIDDINLSARRNTVWRDLVARYGIDVVVVDVRTPVTECIRRDRLRGAKGGRTVGAGVIQLLDKIHLADGWDAAPRFA